MKLFLSVVAVLLVVDMVRSLPSGPPVPSVCATMMPGHGPAAQPGNGGYVILTNLTRIDSTSYAFTAGQNYTVTLMNNGTQNAITTFRGFLIIAHIPGQNSSIIGTFFPMNGNQQLLDCSNNGANPSGTIGHSNPNRIDFSSQQMIWQAPAGANGTVDFRYTVVQQFTTFYVAQSAAQNSPEDVMLLAPTIPVRNPEDYRLTFRTPEGCNVSNCTSFVGIDTNTGDPRVLDIYMEGEALGWVAVGFTKPRGNMFSADVVACNRDPATNLVEVLDTYNAPFPIRNNVVDNTQDVILFNSSFDGARISCTVGKMVVSSDPQPQDQNLNSPVYVIWGIRPTNSIAGSIPAHAVALPSDVPAISMNPVNPSNGAIVTTPVRNPEDYRITFRQPADCQLANCSVFVGIDTNTGDPSVLDITMQGIAGGWLAVGFTTSQSMFDADVVGCTRDPGNNMVSVLDTWNDLSPTRNNIRDDTQDVVLLNSSFIDGTISCTFVKPITSNDSTPQDRMLNSPHFIIYGYRAADNPINDLSRFTVHGVGPDLPTSSAQMLNPAVDSNQQNANLAAPVRAPADYRLVFSSPAGCAPSDCDFFIGIDTNTANPDFLDIYMEGSTQGWVAVGFSDSPNMFAADVVGCNRDLNTDMISAVDTWNDPNARFNSLDDIQNVVLFQGIFTNGRISCTVAKQIASGDVNQDLDLNNGLFVLYGVGPTGSGAAALPPHNLGPGGNPLVSTNRVNAVLDAGAAVPFPTVNLLRAHGILMLISWPLLAISGIFFAAWMRPALPNGEWFKIHQGFLLASMFVGAIGFSLAFIANTPTGGLITLGSSNPIGTAHYALGIIIMFLHILNPIIAAFRCNGGDKYRWIFNLLHGSTIGIFVEILALINISLGLTRFGPSSFFGDLTIFWVYIGYFIFYLITNGVLFLFFTMLAFFSDADRKKTVPSLIKPFISDTTEKPGDKPPPPTEGVELAVPGEKPAAPSDAPPKPKMPSKDAPIRWGALSIFLSVNLVVMIILVILIAIE